LEGEEEGVKGEKAVKGERGAKGAGRGS